MAEPFLGEIRMMSFEHPPKGWALCNGQFLPINQNQALFALLGTTYGGNGQTTFALPDLRGRVPIHTGAGHGLGTNGGASSHTLSLAELPTHTHVLSGTAASAGTANPAGAFPAATNNLYRPGGTLTTLHPASVAGVGGSQAHPNESPYTTISFCIAMQGIFPSAN